MIEFEKTYEVKSTKQYNIFRNIIGNRSIDFKNLERLKLSIKKIGLQNPILVDKTKSIIDGQHRLTAVKELGIPVTYIISKNVTKDYIDELQISKSWSAFDFCNKNALNGCYKCKKAIEVSTDFIKESNGKISMINALSLISVKAPALLKTNLKENLFEIDISTARRVFNGLKILSLNNNPKFNAFSATNSRALKKIDKNIKGIQYKIIEKITKKNYLTTYNNNVQQYQYLMDLYKKHKNK
mgnify:CR=1 FL=1|tara:strand:- start:38 stop:760 length:723 start_codon:yes stop_codon:yes gene_type:complete